MKNQRPSAESGPSPVLGQVAHLSFPPDGFYPDPKYPIDSYVS